MGRVFEKLLSEDFNLGTDAGTKTNPGGGTLTGTKVGVHTFAVMGRSVSGTWDPGSITAGGKESTTITVPGAALGDFVLVSFSADIQELTATGVVSAANTVEVTLANLTGSAVDLDSLTVRVLVFKSKADA